MKILQVHKYYSKKRGSGSVTAFFEIVKILKKKGHRVAIFSMQDETNKPNDYEKYFTTHFDLNEKVGFWKMVILAGKIIFNREAQKKLAELLDKEKPEIAHLHNFYHYLSPSIILTLKKKNIPIVMTLHDYKLICPNYKLFSQGKICEKCKGGKYYQCFLNKCSKNSYAASLTLMIEAYLHKILKTYEKVDLFIAPSHFMKEKCVEFGIPAKKISVLKNPFATEDFRINGEWQEKDYFLYYGRLSEEKGIGDLIRATKKLFDEKKLGENKLFILGKGPEKENLERLVTELKLQDKIYFLGFKTGEELKKTIGSAKFIVLPSVWFDNLPLIVLESQLLQRPLIISDLGGSKELMLTGETGFIFIGGDVEDLVDKMNHVLTLTPEERKAMGEKGRKNALAVNDEEKLYIKLLAIYQEVLDRCTRKED